MLPFSALIFCAVALLGRSAATSCAHPKTLDPVAFSRIKFDYLIIGGGTAGVALSARLAEDAKLTVGVIEAGDFHPDDSIIDVPARNAAGNATYDWGFLSTPQVHAGGRTISFARGKMLGGSSGINGMAWGRATSQEYDAWATFANDPSWSWRGFLPYLQKAETFSKVPANPYPGISPEEAAQADANLPHIAGFSGPIAASYNAEYFDVVPAAVSALNSLGIRTNPQPEAGNTTGVFNSLMSVDRSAGVRSYAATTYYCQHASHQNYHVLLNAQATKILFERKSKGKAVATAVEFVSGGKTFSATARKEVILAAGAVQSPQLLELSGIGNSSILQKHGIKTVVDLPGVGENLQEHLFVFMQWKLKQGTPTFDLLRNNATFAEEQAQLYATNGTGLLAATDSTVALMPLSDISSPERVQELLGLLEKEAGACALERKQSQFAREWFQSGEVPFVELIQWSKGVLGPEAGASYVAMLGGIVQPASRGSIHIASSDPLAPPALDPNFLSKEFDTQVVVDVLKFMRKLGATAPFSDHVAEETHPGPSADSDDALVAYIRAASAGGAHLAGTAPMAPRDLGGVVDGSLKVYGTANVRVVDASVFPILVAAHTQATIYAIAEKVAAEIKSGK